MSECARGFLVVVILFLVAMLCPVPVESGTFTEFVDQFDELIDQEITEGLYYRLVDEDGRVIMETGRRLEAGDQYLDGDNRLYEVVRLEDRTGYVRHVRTVAPGDPEWGALPVGWDEAAGGPVPVQGLPNRRIAVYHTHNGESYVPTRGTPNVDGRGDVHVVGETFREALDEQGVEVIHDETVHLPQDRGAYRRSRNTAAELVAEEPDAVFDIHRDAAPWDAYAERVDGEWLAQIMFVVGRQNPHFAVNRSFAFDLKNYINNEVYPGLIRGVFIANGNYNQDLHPLKLLLEVGAHENTRRAAEEGIVRFAEGVSLYLYGPDPGQPGRAPMQGADRTAAWRNVILVLLVVGLAGGGFYWLNNPEAADRLISEFGRRYTRLRTRLEQHWQQIVRKRR